MGSDTSGSSSSSSKKLQRILLGCLVAVVAFVSLLVASFYCFFVLLPLPILWIESLNPPSWRLKEIPVESDVVGTYALDRTSYNDLEDIGYGPIPSESFISFHHDGTFIATNIPDVLWEWGEAEKLYKSGSGRWKLESGIQGNWVIVTTFNEVEGTPSNATANQFWLIDEGKSYALFNWFTDTRGLLWKPK